MRLALTTVGCLLVALGAGCGGRAGISASAAAKVIEGDWAGAHDAIPAVRWPGHPELAGTAILGAVHCDPPASGARSVGCRFDVAGKSGQRRRVAVRASFDDGGRLSAWTIAGVR